MSRSAEEHSRPEFTAGPDIRRFARTGFGLRRSRPASAPPALQRSRRLSFREWTRTPALLSALSWRLHYQVAGRDALDGLEAPVIFAVNSQGGLDWTVLKNILPPRLRTAQHQVERNLVRGRSVVVFSQYPQDAERVGRFTSQAAELAHQYNVPIVPVGLVGTFKLKEVLRLTLTRKPEVSIRFGTPIYPRGITVASITASLQAAVEALVKPTSLSWWEQLQPAPANPEATPQLPRWRRLWEQSAPTPAPRRRVFRHVK